MKKRIKSLLGWMLFHSGLQRRMMGGHGVVVLFHRIDDRLIGNPISMSTHSFDAYCRFFRRYFNVIPFSEMVSRLERGQSVAGTLAITFDDGYRDNAHAAAPILRQYQLPACFFIATDFIDTDIIPWWDREWGIRSEWMSWDDVRRLCADGFEIGAHTRTHVDLGVVQGEAAEEEIAGSVRRLERELGQRIDLFSYPFGRMEQITERNRELVGRLGLRCCPSAYGGTVQRGDSPFRIQRQPISPWHLNPWQFGYEIVTAAASGSVPSRSTRLPCTLHPAGSGGP